MLSPRYGRRCPARAGYAWTAGSISSRALAARAEVIAMNAVPDVEPLDYATVAAEVTARDREVANKFTKDSQITAIHAARGCIGDRFSRVVARHASPIQPVR